MKRFLLLAAVLTILPITLLAESRSPEEGTIVRMRMTDCVAPRHAFMTAMGGPGGQLPGELCPEYVLVTDKVVYVIIGKSSDQLIPLAETTRFHFQNNEVMIRIDDARKESRFHVKEMTLRPQWERFQQVAEAAEAMTAAHQHLEGAALVNAQQ
jgi:hypothetical protein